MEEISRDGGEKSPQEVEKEIQSIQTVTFNPFIIMPKEMYVKIFSKLDNSTDKHNFMNAHIKWYELFKSNRTEFLFDQVFQEMGRIADKNELGTTLLNSGNYRLVCHEWDRAIQNYFQCHENNWVVNTDWPERAPTVPLTSNWVPDKRFYYRSIEKLEIDLQTFSITHPPEKNPFFSRNVFLYAPSMSYLRGGEVERYTSAVEALLERYGQHIWHCFVMIAKRLDAETCGRIAKWMRLMPALKKLEMDYYLEYAFIPLNDSETKEIEDVELLQPEMSQLVFLNVSSVPSIVFNKLFGKLKGLKRIGILCGKQLENFLVRINRDNLEKAYFSMEFNDLLYLRSTEPFQNIKILSITQLNKENDGFKEWTKLRMMWDILEEKFPALEQLSLGLPAGRPAYFGNETWAKEQSWKELKLAKLKKLWISMTNLASIDFLRPHIFLEELRIVLEFAFESGDSDFDSRVRLSRMNKGIKFNVELDNAWESNIWSEFPKLKILEIETVHSLCQRDLRRYEKVGEKRKYEEQIHSD